MVSTHDVWTTVLVSGALLVWSVWYLTAHAEKRQRAFAALCSVASWGLMAVLVGVIVRGAETQQPVDDAGAAAIMPRFVIAEVATDERDKNWTDARNQGHP